MYTCHKKAFYSRNIYLSENFDAHEGFLLLLQDKVDSFLPTNETTYLAMQMSLKEESFEIFDYSNYFITPGIIDSNVSLSTSFDPGWQDVANITKMAASGGITTIIDHPELTRSDPKTDEITEIKKRIEGMQDKLFVDCGILANISAKSIDELPEIISDDRVLGLKYSTDPPMIPRLKEDTISFQEMFRTIVSKSLLLKDIVLFLKCESANLKDLFPTSPCRGEPLEKRVDLTHNISKINEVSAGGFSHSIGGSDDSPISSNKSDSDEMDEIQEERPAERTESFSLAVQKVVKKSNFGNFTEINSSELKKLSMELDEKKTLEHLRNTELSGYQHEDLGCIQENFDDEQELNFTTDEELRHSEDSISLLEEEQDSYNKANNSGQNSGNSHNNYSTMSMENNNPSSVGEIKRPFCIPLKFMPKIMRNSPLLKEMQGENKYGSENASVDSYDMKNESPNDFRKKRNSLFDRRILSPNSSPLLPYSLEIQTPKMGDIFKNSGVKLNDNSIYEKEIAKKYEFFIANRSVNFERVGIRTLFKEYSSLDNSQKHAINIVLSNVSLSSSCTLLKDQKKLDGNMKIFSEVGLAYLVLHDKKIKLGHCQFKCSPPIRDKDNMNYLKVHLLKNSIDMLGSAHLRVPFKYKIIDEGNFRRAFSGLSTIGRNLNVAWTTLYSIDKSNKYSSTNDKIRSLVKLLCGNPSRILNINDKKGSLEKGKDADFIVWSPFENIRVRKENILVKDKCLYVFKGHKFFGKVRATYLRGCKIFDAEVQGMELISSNRGEILRRSMK